MKTHKIRVSNQALEQITEDIQTCYFVNQIAPTETEQNKVSDLFYAKFFTESLSTQEDIAHLASDETQVVSGALECITFTNARDILKFAIQGVFDYAIDAHIFALENVSEIPLALYFNQAMIFERYTRYTNKPVRIDSLEMVNDPIRNAKCETFSSNSRTYELTSAISRTLVNKMGGIAERLRVQCEIPFIRGFRVLGMTSGSRIRIYPLAHVFKKKVQSFQSEICALLAHTMIHELAHIFENCDVEKYAALCGDFEKNKTQDIKEIERLFMEQSKFGYFGHCSRLKLFILYVGLKLGFIRVDFFTQIKETIKLQDVDFTDQEGVIFANIPEKLNDESQSTYEHRITYSRWESAIQDEFINAMASEKRPIVVPQSFVRKTQDLYETLKELDPKLGTRAFSFSKSKPRSNYAESKSGVKARLLTYDVLETSDGVLNHYLIDADEPFMNIYDCLGASQSRKVNVFEFREGYPFLGITLKENAICPIYVDGFSRQVHEISLEEYWWILSL